MNIKLNNQTFKIVNNYHKFKNNPNSTWLITKKNSFYSFFHQKFDLLFLDHRNSIIFKYMSIPANKYIKVPSSKQKTSILVLPNNASFGLKIGDILVFESEHII